MANRTNLIRLITFRDTKANIESNSAIDEETVFAFASDTNELGIYTNGSWAWIGAGAGQYRQFTYIVESGDFAFVIDDNGEPVMALQDLE
jgi:hypothetical protein